MNRNENTKRTSILIVAVSIVTLAVCALLAFAVIGSIGYARHRLSGHADDRACSALVPETTAHLRSFETRYHQVGYVYGLGMGYCDPAAPVARFEFRGMYRTRETPAVYFQRLDDRTRARRLAYRSAARKCFARCHVHVGEHDANRASRIDGSLYDARNRRLERSGEPTSSPTRRRHFPRRVRRRSNVTNLMQFTMFYPRALPRGWRVDDTMQTLVSDYAARVYVVFDDHGRASRVVERLAPVPARTVCTSFGNVNQNVKDPMYACRRIRNGKRSRGLSVFRIAPPGTNEYGMLADDARDYAVARAQRYARPRSRRSDDVLRDLVADESYAQKRSESRHPRVPSIHASGRMR